MTALTEGNDYRALITVASELRIAVTSLNGAVEALQATVERLEKVALGRALEEMERPRAEQALADGRQRGADATAGRLSVPPNEEPPKRFDTREVVAPAVGMSTAVDKLFQS